jgi:hypothetical protein
MAKKTVKTVTTTIEHNKKNKKRAKRKSSSKKTRKSPEKLSKTLAENLIELQKIHTNLAEKFDNLSNQLSSLLALFEMAAKSFASHPAIKESNKDREFLDKIDKLLEQNKTIAKGLTLMEGKIKERVYGSYKSSEGENLESTSRSLSGRPLPRF